MNLSDLRRDFGKNNSIPDWPNDPFKLFESWLKKAIEFPIHEANAMILSTVNQDHQPSSRVVLLKEFNTLEGFMFFTDYESRKAKDLKIHPLASLLFFWNVMERQIRIEGTVNKVSREVSHAYFNSRPYESRLSAYVSHQSKPITKLEDLIQQRKKVKDSGIKIQCPDRWGGYSLQPAKFEFWQGGMNRLHTRMEYKKDKNEWIKQALAP